MRRAPYGLEGMWPRMGDVRVGGIGLPAGPTQDDLDVASMRLSACRRLVLAAVILLFPALFILDDWLSIAFSPVLPGLLLSALALALGPVQLMGFLVWRARRRGSLTSAVPVFRLHSRATSLLVLSVLVFVVWLAWEG